MNANTGYRRKSGLLIESVNSGSVKDILDEINRVLAGHYGLRVEEFDFIINYDLKFRLGQDGNDGEED
jgi:hypothetical protein